MVALAQVCSQLLLGEVPFKTDELFLDAWKVVLKYFDETMSTMDRTDVKLLQMVVVCGNCYAICRKLENLLRTFFAPLVSSSPSSTLLQNDVPESPRGVPPSQYPSVELCRQAFPKLLKLEEARQSQSTVEAPKRIPLKITPQKKMLSDVYNHIGKIFPAAYGLIGTNRFVIQPLFTVYHLVDW